VFRSPAAALTWWIWALIALASLIDLAVQGRDRFSLLVGIGLVVVTGLVYAGAWRPRIVADARGLTISNPLRDHRVGWPAVSQVEGAELVRVTCEWPLDAGQAANREAAARGTRVIHAWAVHSGRREERLRQLRQEVRGARLVGSRPARPGSGLAVDTDQVAAELAGMAQRARDSAGGAAIAVAPASRWRWPAIAAIVVPALALLIAVLL
jgi:hypothetical protein